MANKGAFTFESCSKDKWEAIFGEWTPDNFHAAKEELDAKHASDGDSEAHLVAIHGDDAARRMFSGFDSALGVYIDPHRARAHRREVMQAKGLVECG